EFSRVLFRSRRGGRRRRAGGRPAGRGRALRRLHGGRPGGGGAGARHAGQRSRHRPRRAGGGGRGRPPRHDLERLCLRRIRGRDTLPAAGLSRAAFDLRPQQAGREAHRARLVARGARGPHQLAVRSRWPELRDRHARAGPKRGASPGGGRPAGPADLDAQRRRRRARSAPPARARDLARGRRRCRPAARARAGGVPPALRGDAARRDQHPRVGSRIAAAALLGAGRVRHGGAARAGDDGLAGGARLLSRPALPGHDAVSRTDDLQRIRAALRAAAEAIRPYAPGDVAWERKEERGDPVTAADHAADAVLRAMLPAAGEGWLSEESVDDAARLRCDRVWVVDPIDGTREFIDGIPEWCVSIGLLENGEPVAGGILNPATDELMIGAAGSGVIYEGPEGPEGPALEAASAPPAPTGGAPSQDRDTAHID